MFIIGIYIFDPSSFLIVDFKPFGYEQTKTNYPNLPIVPSRMNIIPKLSCEQNIVQASYTKLSTNYSEYVSYSYNIQHVGILMITLLHYIAQ